MKAAKPSNSAVHPGQVIRDELNKLGISANALAQALGVPGNRITEIMRGQRGITADTALRLARFFSTEPEYWMNLQQAVELQKARANHGKEIAKTIKPQNRRAVNQYADQ